ncbi:MAG TPA: hypothetical protein PKE15_00275 [Ottowia sp.]|nr:hypothetical protein [Ottowia sp.]
MLNTVSAELFDPAGHVLLDVTEGSAFHPVPRRVNRVKTLDGGAVINDGGYTPADRTITLVWAADSEDAHAAVSRLLQLHPRLVVSTRDGVFLAAPEHYRPGPDQSSLRLLVTAKLST